MSAIDFHWRRRRRRFLLNSHLICNFFSFWLFVFIYFLSLFCLLCAAHTTHLINGGVFLFFCFVFLDLVKELFAQINGFFLLRSTAGNGGIVENWRLEHDARPWNWLFCINRTIYLCTPISLSFRLLTSDWNVFFFIILSLNEIPYSFYWLKRFMNHDFCVRAWAHIRSMLVFLSPHFIQICRVAVSSNYDNFSDDIYIYRLRENMV